MKTKLKSLVRSVRLRRARKAAPAAARTRTGRAVGTAAAKWLIPTVGAFFVAVGYIIHAAHVSMLGIDFRDIVPENYTGDAADFFAGVPTALFDFASSASAGQARLSIHSIDILLGLVLLALALLSRRFLHASPLRAPLLGVLLVLAVGGKLLLFDAPLSMIEGVAVGHLRGGKQLGVEPGWHPPPDGNFGQRLVRARASRLWTGIQCQRLSDKYALGAPSGHSVREQDLSVTCNEGRDEARDEFVMQTAAVALILVLAGLALVMNSAALNVLGVLALLYCFTLPYAYGKLMKPTNFQYGWVELSKEVAARIKPETGELDRLQAIVLGYGPGGLSFLYMHEDNCSDLKGEKRTYRVAKIWTVPSSQVLAVREIYREDLIRWKILNEKECGAAPPPLPDADLCTQVPPERWSAMGLNCK